MAKVQVQQSKVIMELASLYVDKKASTSDVTRVKGLVECQDALVQVLDLQSGLVGSQAAMLLKRCEQQRLSADITFLKFRQLPPEIRRKVWEIALPDTRIFEPYFSEHYEMLLSHTHKPPAMRAACKKAWLVTEEHGTFEFGLACTSNHGFWFNASRDIAINIHDPDLTYIEPSFSNVQIVALEWYHFETSTKCIRVLESALWNMERCRKIIILHRPKIGGGIDMDYDTKLFSLRDDNIIWRDELAPDFWKSGSAITWADMKGTLLRMYHDKKTLQELGIEEDKVPEIEGMEIVRSKKTTTQSN